MSYTTKKSLLEAIKNGDEISWNDFYNTYRPLIFLRGHDYRLSPDDMEDLCQQVLLDVFKMAGKFQYDPEKGRFRDYLRRVISHNAIDLIRKRNGQERNVNDVSDDIDSSLETAWNEEWDAHVLNQALSVLKTQMELATYQAFELYVLKEVPPEDVASFLNISVGMVYVAKTRAIARLRKIIKQLREE